MNWKSIQLTHPDPPLTNLQLELLKLFSTNLSEEELLEVKEVLAIHFAKKSMDQADKVWDEKGFTSKDMNDILDNN